MKEFLVNAEAPPPLPHPEMAGFYHQQISRLHDMLHSEPDEKRQEAAEVIRSLIEAIILIPSDKGLQIDVRGDLAGILTVASGRQTKTPARYGTGVRDAFASQGLSIDVKSTDEEWKRMRDLDAGAGFEPATFRL